MWQFWASFFCVVGVVLLSPVSWAEEHWGWRQQMGKGEEEVRTRKRDAGRLDGWNDEELLRKAELRRTRVG